MQSPIPPSARPAAGRPRTVRVRSYWGSVWQRLRYDYVTLFCLALIIAIVLSAVFAPWLSPMDPYKSSMAHRLRPIGFRNYLLGTVEQGHDILTPMLYGGRVSLTMGMWPVALATIIGGLFGVVAGYFGGKINMLIMRTMDVFFAFPSVLLAVAISGNLGGGITNQLLTLTVGLDPAALPRDGNRDQPGVDDGLRRRRALDGRLDALHPVHGRLDQRDVAGAVYASTLVSVSIILASGLSLLGLGVSPPTADWGLMLSTLRESIYVQPLVSAIPGVAILITSIARNLLSDGLHQAMDVRA
jgi:peptide/nickel transport system permease protein